MTPENFCQTAGKGTAWPCNNAPIPVCDYNDRGTGVPPPPAPSRIVVCPQTFPLGSGPGAKFIDFPVYPGFPKIGWVRCAKCYTEATAKPAGPTPCLGLGGSAADYKCSGPALTRTCDDPAGAYACLDDGWGLGPKGYCSNPQPMPSMYLGQNVTELCVADCSECN